jgi:hypothetical protein
MSLSTDPVPDDERLIRYLLGLLPGEDAERLDEQCVIDDDAAARLRAAENDLVDAYVRGALNGERLARFESYYLASPLRREKVQFAKRFVSAIDRSPAPGASASRPVPRGADQVRHLVVGSEARQPTMPRFVALLTIAALLVLACGALFFVQIRLQRGLTSARREMAAVDQRAQRLAGQLEDQRAANAAIAQQLAQAHAQNPIATIALVLRPQTRAAGPIPAIVVPPEAQVVAFDLRLDGLDFVRYQVSLEDPATNRAVWRSPTLMPDGSRRSLTLSVSVPARLLKPQHYSFELFGGRAAGAFDIAGSYAFQVEPR